MRLQLDARRRAMLDAMGMRTFAPEPAPDSAAVRPVAARAAPPPDKSPVAASVAAPVARREPAAQEPGLHGVDQMDWAQLVQAVPDCRACKVGAGRRATVFGAGDPQPDWLIVGDPPDENEEAQGEPFAGEPGVLLDNMLKALGLGRERKVYLTNVMKCRPQGNRNPQPGELAQCEPILRRQVELLRPRIILAMGRFAVQSLLGSTEPIGKLRGRGHHYQGVPVVVTYHPSYLLRTMPDKAKAWADLCLARQLMRDQPA